MAFSIGIVTRFSTSEEEPPGRTVEMKTMGMLTSGLRVRGDVMKLETPRKIMATSKRNIVLKLPR